MYCCIARDWHLHLHDGSQIIVVVVIHSWWRDLAILKDIALRLALLVK